MEKFAKLDESLRKELILNAAEAGPRGIPPYILEKDFWVCWTLRRLFEDPWLKEKLVFRGGTSLSKAFGLLERMSEDIDLTFPIEMLSESNLQEMGRNKRKELLKEVSARTPELVEEEFLPRISAAVGDICSAEIEFNSANEITGIINISYPVALDYEYILKKIKLELGCKGATEPQKDCRIEAYVTSELSGKYEFEESSAQVVAVIPQRTFWDKVVIVHSIVQQSEIATLRGRQARHFLDLAQMAANEKFLESVLRSYDLLCNVVEYRFINWNESRERNELILQGKLTLLPANELMRPLRSDYEQMQKMVFGEILEFERLLSRLEELEERINRWTLNESESGGANQ